MMKGRSLIKFINIINNESGLVCKKEADLFLCKSMK